MTTTNDIAMIATEIETLEADLLKVNAAIETIGADILGKAALNKANDIAKSLADAKDRLDTALANQATTEREQRLSRFADIRVVTAPGDNLISTGFRIHYKRLTWDMGLCESVLKDHECNGFAALDDDAYEYLVTVKPHAIPAVIIALAPGEPEKALSIYLQGKARGFFKAVTL